MLGLDTCGLTHVHKEQTHSLDPIAQKSLEIQKCSFDSVASAKACFSTKKYQQHEPSQPDRNPLLEHFYESGCLAMEDI